MKNENESNTKLITNLLYLDTTHNTQHAQYITHNIIHIPIMSYAKTYVAKGKYRDVNSGWEDASTACFVQTKNAFYTYDCIDYNDYGCENDDYEYGCEYDYDYLNEEDKKEENSGQIVAKELAKLIDTKYVRPHTFLTYDNELYLIDTIARKTLSTINIYYPKIMSMLGDNKRACKHLIRLITVYKCIRFYGNAICDASNAKYGTCMSMPNEIIEQIMIYFICQDSNLNYIAQHVPATRYHHTLPRLFSQHNQQYLQSDYWNSASLSLQLYLS